MDIRWTSKQRFVLTGLSKYCPCYMIQQPLTFLLVLNSDSFLFTIYYFYYFKLNTVLITTGGFTPFLVNSLVELLVVVLTNSPLVSITHSTKRMSTRQLMWKLHKKREDLTLDLTQDQKITHHAPRIKLSLCTDSVRFFLFTTNTIS